jgi:hypothetical protein
MFYHEICIYLNYLEGMMQNRCAFFNGYIFKFFLFVSTLLKLLSVFLLG